MFHPLAPRLTDLTDEELNKKISELTNKIGMAYRMGSGHVAQQMQLLMLNYQEEQSLRNRKRLEELDKVSKNFKNIIDIQ